MRNSILRRLPIAVLIAVLVSVGVGAAVATDESEPASMVVAEPMAGDRGAYSVQLDGRWSSDWDDYAGTPAWDEPWDALEFAWSTKELRTDRGEDVAMSAVDVETVGWWFRGGWELEVTELTFGYHSGAPVVTKLVADDESTGGLTITDPTLGEIGPVLGSSSGAEMETSRYHGAAGHCFLGPALAGRELQVGAEAPLDVGCGLSGLSTEYSPSPRFVAPETVVHVTGVEEIGGMSTMHVVFVDEGLEAWYAPGISVPVQYTIHEGDRHATFTLTGFERGTEAFDEEPMRATPAALETASLRPWGIAGMETLTFPADKAYEMLEEHSDFGPFIDDGGVVVANIYQEYQDPNGQVLHVWGFTLSDGDDAMGAIVYQRLPPGMEGLPPALIDAVAQRDVQPFDPGAPVDVSDLPTAAPTMGAAAARWRDQGGEGDVNLVGFRYCDTCDGRIAVLAGDWVSRQFTQEPDPADPSTTSEWRVDYVALDAEGDMLEAYRSEFTYDPVAAPEEVEREQEAAPLAAVSSDSWISPGQAATIGIFGLLAGALYALWPFVKAAPVAMFSRLKKPQLLEHPTRQMIVDAVTSQPGIHLNDLRRLTGLANGTMRHHVDHLVRNDILTKRQNAGYTCLFLKATDRRELDIAPVLRSEGARTVLDTVRANPGMTGKQVAATTGLSAGTVAYHVRRLVEAGAITSTRQGRQVALTAA